MPPTSDITAERSSAVIDILPPFEAVFLGIGFHHESMLFLL